MTIIRQSPPAIDIETEQPVRSVRTSLSRGWQQKCPSCGSGALYRSYLKVDAHCPACGEELHHQRADDAPAYFTILIVAHIVGAGILFMEQNLAPPTWLELAIWLPLTCALTLTLLPRIKGTLIAYQWANRMHGFGGPEVEGVDIPPAETHAANG